MANPSKSTTLAVQEPDSVFRCFDWLQANQSVRRVKVSSEAFRRYVVETAQDLRYTGHSTAPIECITYRGRQGIFPEWAWARRHRWYLG